MYNGEFGGYHKLHNVDVDWIEKLFMIVSSGRGFVPKHFRFSRRIAEKF
jgi:hypothetical protein